MDWELYERQRATLTFVGVVLLSLIFLAFQRSSPVQHLKAFLVSCALPSQRIFSQFAAAPIAEKPIPVEEVLPSSPIASPDDAAMPVPAETLPNENFGAEKSRVLRVLAAENARLSGVLNLKRDKWPRLVAAHVVSRDPQRWFQEILLDKGYEDNVQVDDPVVALMGGREALVGRVVESGAHTSRVMLIHDSLSSVPASLSGTATEDGVVEGTNSQDLYLRYLHRDSQVKIGDLVVTSGLGKMFPEGVPVGWVREIGPDPRQLFLQARLTPAMVSGPLRLVGVLTRPGSE